MKKSVIMLLSAILVIPISVYSQQKPKIINITVTTPNDQRTICLGQSIHLWAKAEVDYGNPEIEFMWDNCNLLNRCDNWDVVATPTVLTTFRVLARIKGDPDQTWQIPGKPGTVEIAVNKPCIVKILVPAKDTAACVNQPILLKGVTKDCKGIPK